MKTTSYRRALLIAVPMIAFGILSVVWIGLAGHGSNQVYVNPYPPLSPVPLDDDWFTRLSDHAETTNIVDALGRVDFQALTRCENDKPIEPAATIMDKALLRDGTELDTFTARYSDRIQVTVTPTDEPINSAELLAQEASPNTSGETRTWFRISVRGSEGVAREAGTQKFQGGEMNDGGAGSVVNNYPAVVQWVEASPSGQLVHYAVLGDTTVMKLIEIADGLDYPESNYADDRVPR